MFQHPEKWRDTCDIFALDYHTFRPIEILGYPHARNDIFHVKGIYKDQETTAYVKAARLEDSAIGNEISILGQLALPHIPKILDYSTQNTQFIVTEEMPGLRLSVIVGENENNMALSYMEEYGEALGYFHTLKPNALPVADRKFFHVPADEILEKLGISYLKPYFARIPDGKTTVFCHGDFHYANILWEEHQISGILDYELSGYGDRDFDIAWALILRPGQKFLTTEAEQELFLKGYRRYGTYNAYRVRYYMAQIYTWFLQFRNNDPLYTEYVKGWLAQNCRDYGLIPYHAQFL